MKQVEKAASGYDFIIAGGGAAGLSLAYHLMRSPLRERSILIVDVVIQSCLVADLERGEESAHLVGGHLCDRGILAQEELEFAEGGGIISDSMRAQMAGTGVKQVAFDGLRG